MGVFRGVRDRRAATVCLTMYATLRCKTYWPCIIPKVYVGP